MSTRAFAGCNSKIRRFCVHVHLPTILFYPISLQGRGLPGCLLSRSMYDELLACLQRGRKPKKVGEGAPKPAPQWKVSEVRALEEALLQHGEGRTATTCQTVSAPSPSHAQDCLWAYQRLFLLARDTLGPREECTGMVFSR